MLKTTEVPNHVAIIMDGNGRWAAEQGKRRSTGHIQGAQTADEIATYIKKRGVKILTLYAFSSENWNRPEYEVSVLMKLTKRFIQRLLLDDVRLADVQVRCIGERSKLSPLLRRLMSHIENRTRNRKGYILQIAFSYGGREEVVAAVNSLVQKVAAGRLSLPITESDITSHLYTNGVPDPDLVIRTGGEHRTSNFLPWQTTYSEWYFSDKYWPDFSIADFDKCIEDFQGRQRRRGKTPEQVANCS